MDIYLQLFTIFLNFVPILTIGLIILFVIKVIQRLLNGTSSPTGKSDELYSPSSDIYQQIANERDKIWLDYIKALRDNTANKTEIKLLERIIKENSDAPSIKTNRPFTNQASGQEFLNTNVNEPSGRSAASAPAAFKASSKPASKNSEINLDGTSLLLYFGAFLFVAASGLFVAFGDINGGLRTFIVLLVMLTMYTGGFWLHGKPKLKQAGVAFVAIGMAIAPLLGVAFYNFVSDQSNGPVIWLATSLLCFAMYYYALYRIRISFIAYLVVFSFLSVFQSGVAIFDLPTYFFVWSLLAAGLVLQGISYTKSTWLEIRDSSAVSARFIMPLMIFTSLAFVGDEGYAPLAVSLGLGSLYYAIEGFYGPLQHRLTNKYAAHATLLGALGTVTFAFTESLPSVSVVLFVASLCHTVLLMTRTGNSPAMRNFADVSLMTITLAPLLNPSDSTGWMLILLLAIALGVIISLKQNREEAVWYAGIVLVVLPLILGKIVLDPPADNITQILLSSIAALVLYGLSYGALQWQRIRQWQDTIMTLFAISSLVPMYVALQDGHWSLFVVSLVASLFYLAYGILTANSTWRMLAGLFILAPVVYAWSMTDHVFHPVAVLAALAVNIILALVYRHELNRWFSTILWLLVPVSIGLGGFGFTFDAALYAWTYFIAGVCLVLSRAIARGVVFLNTNIPMTSFAHTQSMSYVYGYSAAFVIAFFSSVFSDNNQLHAPLIIASLLLITYLLGKHIEQQTKVFVLIPLLAQLLIGSIFIPMHSVAGANILAAASITTTLALYFLSNTDSRDEKDSKHIINISTLWVSYLAVLFMSSLPAESWLAPFSLILSGLLTLDYNWKGQQNNRELSILVSTFASLWLLNSLDITNPQIYTHIVAAVLALFAVWRNARREIDNYHMYMMLAFFTVTVPLILQALGGESGSMYGWLLIVEQVLILIIGTYVKEKFLIWAGLYTALGAVLYQLRGLGWAALLILAIFVIGVALRRLSKNIDSPSDSKATKSGD